MTKVFLNRAKERTVSVDTIIISTKNIKKAYGTAHALRRLSLSVANYLSC